MKLGLFTPVFGKLDAKAMLAKVRALEKVQAIELGTGGWPGHDHLDVDALLADKARTSEFRAMIGDAGLTISALSCHGNPLHPDRATACMYDEVFRKSVRLAEQMDVPVVVTFSGCPGESEHSLRPSWVTCSWPDDFPATLAWQWDERVLPYWAEAAPFAEQHGIRVAIEPHPGFVVYNTASMLRLRDSAGESVGVNFDPSHLFWQGMDPLACVDAFGDAIFHVHAKDTAFQDELLALNGVLEPIPGNRPAERSWIFRSVGAGHPVEFWRELVAVLGAAGYDGALSIEHEDPLLSHADGLELAVTTLRAALDEEKV